MSFEIWLQGTVHIIITYHNFEVMLSQSAKWNPLQSYRKKYYLRVCREDHLMITLSVSQVNPFIFLYAVIKKKKPKPVSITVSPQIL